MLYDDALRAIGDFGRYQYFILVYCGVSSASVAMSVYSFVFIISTGNYWCKNPNTNVFNVTFNHAQNSSSQTEYSDRSLLYSQCTIYGDLHNNSYPQDTFDSLGSNNSEMEIGCPYGWVYEDADTETTITMEWDLVCHREHLAGITHTVYMAGNLFGIILSGFVADRFGRFKTIVLFQTAFAVSATITPFSTDVIMFCVLRFFTGIFGLPSTSTALILLMEIVTPEKRAFATSIRLLCWMAGMLLAVGAAYLFRNWRTFMLVIATPTMLNAILLFFIPESPRWLYTKGRYKEGDAVMAKFARWNGYPVLQDRIETTEKKDDGSREQLGTLKILCKYPRLLGRIAVMAYMWSAVVLAFFGLTFNSISLGNKYMNFAISAAIEMPTYVLIGVAMDRLGRRNMTGVPLLLGGGVLLLIMAVPSDPDTAWILIIMTNIGKFLVSTSFGVIYPYTTELFPTVIRNSALGFMSTCGRFSSLIAPQLTLLALRNKYIPLAIFGALALLAGALAFLLPETTGLALPETLEDGERMGMKRKHKNDMADINNGEQVPALALNTEEC